MAQEPRAWPGPVAVLGLGNTLLGDDGVGPTVVEGLERKLTFPEDARVLDVGTPGLDLTPYLLDLEAVLFVDAVDLRLAPGTVTLLEREEILACALPPRVSPHDPGVQQALQVVELASGRTIDAAVLGVQPLRTRLGDGLSPVVQAALPRLEAAVLEWLADRGVHPRPKPGADVAPRGSSDLFVENPW